VHAGEKIRKMTRTSNELSAELGREPTDEEIAQRLSWEVEQVREAKEAIPHPTTSLNGPLVLHSSKTVNKGTPPMPSSGLLRSAPHPRLRSAVELQGCNLRCSLDLFSVGKGLAR
jgi:hypothetical protein